jgi:hypothetical protein
MIPFDSEYWPIIEAVIALIGLAAFAYGVIGIRSIGVSWKLVLSLFGRANPDIPKLRVLAIALGWVLLLPIILLHAFR